MSSIAVPTLEVSNTNTFSAAVTDPKALKVLSEYFNNSLHSEEAQYVRDYIHSRGITDNTIEAFKLGWCPSNWNGYYKWTNRLMVPLVDSHNNNVAFHTRIITQNISDSFGNQYIQEQNTGRIIKETFVNGEKKDHDLVWHHGQFEKSYFLFGLDVTKDLIKEKNYVILVEGIFDALILFENGLKNVVATLGTALTEHQICLLKRYADLVIFMFDADKAGYNASKKAQSKSFIQYKNLILPDGYDPHDFVLKHGIDLIIEGINKNISE